METPLRSPAVDMEQMLAEETAEVPMAEGELEPDRALFLNRELSIVEFQRRVLAQARDSGAPILERLRFLTIYSSILDEFFEIRVAGLQQDVELGLGLRGPDGLEATEVLRRISETVHARVAEQYRLLNQVILPQLEAHGIRVLKRAGWNPRQREWVESWFLSQALPVLTPMGLDPAHPFPMVQNKALSFVVTLEGSDAFERDSGIAIVPVPRCLPRLLQLPPELRDSPHDFVMISSIIHEHVDRLFPGMRVTGCHQFRLTRNSNLWVEEEEIDDLLRALKTELPRRRYGAAVRLEVSDECTPRMAAFLLDQFGLSEEELFRVSGPVNLHRLTALYDMVDRPDLKFRPFKAGVEPSLHAKADFFEVVGRGDVLLHHPYQSFQPVVDFLRQAATDPEVLAIKQTLYRTGGDSPIVNALLDAARNGKDVTAVVELRARFDEAANIEWATQLQEAGANVVYGIVGYKCHAKVLMVVRREGAALRRYVHLGTGNYHVGTARAYTDWSLLTANPEVGEDAHRFFNQLTGLGSVVSLSHLLHSPFRLFQSLIDLIGAEAEAARAGRKGRIIAKMNALTEPDVVRALYQASQAGVEIDLIVRGACRLRPGIPGVSDNIRVRSIVGRFLEHERVACFYADGEDRVYCSSADWMSRNLLRRVELCYPILDLALKRRVIEESLTMGLADDTRAWELQADGSWVPTVCRSDAPTTAQLQLLERLSEPPRR